MTSPYLTQEPRSIDQAKADLYESALPIAIAWKKIVWRQAARDDDERLNRLHDICTRLLSGDREAGRRLATTAVWSPS